MLAAGASPHAEAYGDGGAARPSAVLGPTCELAERARTEPPSRRSICSVAAGLGRVDLMQALFKGKTRCARKPDGIATSIGRIRAFRRGRP